jgi:parallel beta-helix repeat protein
MIRQTLTILLTLCALATPAQAATYFVSLSGNDSNSCETAQNFDSWYQKRTIAAGVACLSPGDTLYIRGGTYDAWGDVIDSQLFPVRSGWSFEAPIVIAGYPGERVVLMPPHNMSGVRLTSGAPHHLILRDFTIDQSYSWAGADAAGIMMAGGHHIRFERIEVTHSQSFGVHFGPESPDNEMLNCRIHDNGDQWASWTNGHALYISSSRNLFEGNEVYNNDGYGFHIYSNHGDHSDPSYNIVRGNYIYGNGRPGLPGYGVMVAWGTGNIIQGNQVYGNQGGIQVYSWSSDTTVAGNVIFSNAAEGIALQYYSSGSLIMDNTVFSNPLAIADYGGYGWVMMGYNLTD